MASGIATTAFPSASFAPMSAQRLLVFGGIALIVGGMLFGDIFAVFVLHQNAGQTGASLLAAAQAAAARNPAQVSDIFGRVGGLLEDRGTKVDAHVHMTDAGYLALLLALLQPYVAFSNARKKLLARLFLTGGIFLPIGIFLIHYVGLAYSPSDVIGWASVLADSAGALMVLALVAEGWGLIKYLLVGLPDGGMASEPEYSWCERTLLAGGTGLVLLGFLLGAWYSAFDLYRQEGQEQRILTALAAAAERAQTDPLIPGVNAFGMLQADKAVKIAAHSHIIEFGVLAMLLAFVQRYVLLSERWRRRWVAVLLAGSVVLPVFVFLELQLGLLAGGIADCGGLLVVIALIGMLVGVVRYSGRTDAAPERAG